MPASLLHHRCPQRRPLLPLLVLVLLIVLLLPLAGAFKLIGAEQHGGRRRSSSSAITMSAAVAKTVDCGVIIAGAGPAGQCQCGENFGG